MGTWASRAMVYEERSVQHVLGTCQSGRVQEQVLRGDCATLSDVVSGQ